MFYFTNKDPHVNNTHDLKIATDSNNFFGCGGVPNLNERQWSWGASVRIV